MLCSWVRKVTSAFRLSELDLPASVVKHFKEFKASNSWVHNFAKHYKLNWGKPHGEAADVPVEPTEEGVARLKELIKQYAPRDVYNADEFALY